MKQNELKKLADKLGIETEGLTKQDLIEELSPFAEDAKEDEEEDDQPMERVNKQFWDEVATKAKDLPLVPPEKLSLDAFSACKTEAEVIALTKSIFRDFGVSDKDVVAGIELLEKMENEELPENMEESDFAEYRKGLLLQIRKKLDSLPAGRLEQAITGTFKDPYGEQDSPGTWMKGYCMELILTTLLDSKPSFDTNDNWDEDLFLEKVNDVLSAYKLQVSYDPEYDWEDTTGAQPLTVTLETTDGKFIAKTEYKFPDPEEFDQGDLMDPVNQLLKPKDLRFMDASWFGEETASYNWLLMPAKEADRLEAKYGKLTDWYSEFPDRMEEMLEEGEGEEEMEEEAEPEEVEVAPKKGQQQKKIEPPQPTKRPQPEPVQVKRQQQPEPVQVKRQQQQPEPKRQQQQPQDMKKRK